MKRSEIEEKYKWDLSDYCESFEKCKEETKNILLEIEKFSNYKNQIIENNDAKIFECLSLDSKISEKMSVLFVYAEARFAEDARVVEATEIMDIVQNMLTIYGEKSSFISTSLAKLSNEYLLKLQNNKQFPQFSNYFRDIIKEKQHILSEKEEVLLSKLSPTFSSNENCFQIFETKDLKFQDAVDKNGKKYKLDFGSISLYLESDDETLRKSTYKSVQKAYKNAKNVVGNLYVEEVKLHGIMAKIRNYKSTLDQALQDDDIPFKVYDNLMKETDKNLDLCHKTYKINAKILNEKKIKPYNIGYIPFKAKKFEVEYEDAFKIVKQCLSLLGEDYVNNLQKLFDKRIIDVFENEGKISSQYMQCAYGKHPIVFIKYSKTLEMIETLAHELGHAMHSYYTNKSQPYEKSNYPIFLGEIASTVNELILLSELIKKETNKEVKIVLYNKLAEMIRNTIFMQAEFSQFEDLAHKKYEQDGTLSVEYLTEEFTKLCEKFGSNLISGKKKLNYSWNRVPHFYYSPFYVYKYATGMLAAIKIVQNIYSNPVVETKKYIEFLSSGSSEKPLDLLKKIGVDFENPKTFSDAFMFCREIINEYEKLVF